MNGRRAATQARSPAATLARSAPAPAPSRQSTRAPPLLAGTACRPPPTPRIPRLLDWVAGLSSAASSARRGPRSCRIRGLSSGFTRSPAASPKSPPRIGILLRWSSSKEAALHLRGVVTAQLSLYNWHDVAREVWYWRAPREAAAAAPRRAATRPTAPSSEMTTRRHGPPIKCAEEELGRREHCPRQGP